MIVLTLTIWGAFGVIYTMQRMPIYTFDEVQAWSLIERQKEESVMRRFDVTQSVSEDTFNDNDEAIIEQNETENDYGKASGPSNDILYSFERDQPVSIDQLLVALGISE